MNVLLATCCRGETWDKRAQFQINKFSNFRIECVILF